MPSFYNNFKITFFGSDPLKSFKQHKSLHDNFMAMCSLPFYQADSSETSKLLEVLKACELHSTSPHSKFQPQLTLVQRRADIARMEIAVMALNNWLAERATSSTRVTAVKRFMSGLKQMQAMLVLQDSHEFDNSNQANRNSGRMWRNILYFQDDLKQYLNVNLRKLFENNWQALCDKNKLSHNQMKKYKGIY